MIFPRHNNYVIKIKGLFPTLSEKQDWKKGPHQMLAIRLHILLSY